MLRFARNRAKPTVITLADRARDQGHWERAAGYYQVALRRNPQNPPIWVQYGHVLKEAGDLANAERAYRTALGYDPRNGDTYVQLGHILKIQGKKDEARAAYLKAVAIDPSLKGFSVDLESFGWSEAHFAQLRDMLGARAYDLTTPLSDLSASRDNHANGASSDRFPMRQSRSPFRFGQRRRRPSRITLADQARDAGKWGLAAQHYRAALDRNPRNAPIWVQYGHALKESRNLSEAEHAYRKAIEIDPIVADPHLQLGHLLKIQDRKEEARTAYLRAIAVDPSLSSESFEFSQLGWSEDHLSTLRRMLGPAGNSEMTPPHQNGECISGPSEKLILYIDRPEIADGSAKRTIRSGLLVDGWALARSGVASIDVAVGGGHLIPAHYGIPRADVLEAHPDWENSERSGFMISIPSQLLPKGTHAVRVTLRDNCGNTTGTAFWIDVAEVSGDDGLRRKISQAEIDLQERILSSLNWRPKFYLLMLVDRNEDQLTRARATLASLRAQAYTDWHILVALGDYGRQPDWCGDHLLRTSRTLLQRDGLLDGFDDISERVELLQRGESQSLAALIGRPEGPALFGLLTAGDVLGCDALLEFAVIRGMHRDADLLYCDELRISAVSKAVEPFLKPQWSLDLLLSTNYIGRFWCATVGLIERTGATLEDLFELGEYDLVLRATEAANEIRHIPELLCRRANERLESEEIERRALELAIIRRGIDGEVLTTGISGTYRVRRRQVTQGLVSIIIPTRASRGLIRTCIETLRSITAYGNFEIICIDNIPDDQQDWKRWLRTNSDKVIEIAEPFNWSRYNNRAVEEAAGQFLLFLNDDTEIIEPNWLGALVEHGQRPEVGVVGPMLLWPDRSVQSAGVFLTNDVGIERHAFRNAAEGDPGYFGLALTQRNVIAINGACFFTRKDVFERLDGFNEYHRVVNNETDYCFRAWREGLLLVFTPYSKIIHHERASRTKEGEDYDARDFEKQWGALFVDGDPYHHPHLSKERDSFAPEPEPLRVIRPGHPLLKRGEIRRILVVKLDHIGDCITAFPAIRRLKEVFPHASLRVLAGQWTKPIWSLAEMIDEVIEFDFFHAESDRGVRGATETELQSLLHRLTPYRFDLAVDLRRHPETRHILQYTGARFLAGCDIRGNFPWLDIAPEWGGDAARAPKRGHAADELVHLADAICAACEPERPVIAQPSDVTLPVSESLRRWLLTRPVVCVHPAAGGALKQWPPEHFAILIDMLVEREHVNVVLIGSPDDKAITSRVLRSVRNRWAVLDLIGEPVNKFAQLHTLLLHCALFVGNDSGPKHLAAGLGVPTLGIHSGQVDAREWGPVGPYSVALQREMECSPCYLTNPADCHRRAACLTGLMPGEVYVACKRLLALRIKLPLHETDCLSQSDNVPTEPVTNASNATSPFQWHRAGTLLRGANRFDYFDAQWYLTSNPDVASSGTDAFEHYTKYGREEGRKPNARPGTWVPVTDADIRCLKQPSFQSETALFVTHSPDGYLKSHVYHYLDSLRSQSIQVVLIVAADAPFLDADGKLVAATDGIYIRRNQGYDFAAWAHVLRLQPEFFSSDILYLINDSLFGPTKDELFGRILGRLRSSPADLVGLTENYKKGWHIQSYFLALRSSVLSSPIFQKFIRNVVSYQHKEDVINEYEVKLASTLKAAGFECEAVFRTFDSKDLTTEHWKHLFRSGFPFIKMGVLRDTVEGVDTSDWRKVLGEAGCDVSLAERALAQEHAVEA